MKISLTWGARDLLQRTLKWARRALLVSATVLLGYCVFAYWDAWIYQARQTRDLDEPERLTTEATPGASELKTPNMPLPPSDGALVGRIEIARIGLSAIVAEGVGSKTLRRAAGHVPGTAFPGQGGNVGIAGHRDTFFRPLERVRVDDMIVFTAHGTEYRYRVVFSQIVSPEDVAVLDPIGNDVLTLVTCHPFYFVGPAPNRFIVRAARV